MPAVRRPIPECAVARYPAEIDLDLDFGFGRGLCFGRTGRFRPVAASGPVPVRLLGTPDGGRAGPDVGIRCFGCCVFSASIFGGGGVFPADGVRHCVLCPARSRRDAVRDGVRVSADGVRHCVLCPARSRRDAVRDGVRVSADGVRHCVLCPARSRRDAVSDGVRIPAYGVPAPHSMQPR